MDQALVNHYAQIFGWTQTDKDVLLSDSKIREQVIRFINNNQLHHSSSVKEALKVHLELLRTNPDYFSLNSAIGVWPGWMWDIAGDVLVEIAQAILKKNLPGVNLPGNVIAAIKSCGTGDLLSCIGNTIDVLKEFFPGLRAIDLAIDTAENVVKATKLWKAFEKVQHLGEAAVTQAWDILKKMSFSMLDVEDLSKYIRYVDDLKVPKLGLATKLDYSKTYYETFPEINPNSIYQIHHALPQASQYRDNLINAYQVHSIENLRGIPSDKSWIHGEITGRWTTWYNTKKDPDTGAFNYTLQEALDFAKTIDDDYGVYFIPPVR